MTKVAAASLMPGTPGGPAAPGALRAPRPERGAAGPPAWSTGLRRVCATSPATVALVLAFSACQVEARDTVPANQAPAQTGAQPGQPGSAGSTGSLGSLTAAVQAAHRRMHVRFAAAERIELAIAHSDLDRAHAEAHALTQLDEPDVLPSWRPYFASIRDAAHQIELSPGVVGVARLTATLGRRCGGCHEATHARIAFPAEPAPAKDPRLAVQMMTHQWAAAQMWQGLIGPSEARWMAGARALTTAPLQMVAQAVTPSSELDIDDVARIRLYARRAETTGSQDARAELFGTLLATCAHCHAMLRDR